MVAVCPDIDISRLQMHSRPGNQDRVQKLLPAGEINRFVLSSYILSSRPIVFSFSPIFSFGRLVFYRCTSCVSVLSSSVFSFSPIFSFGRPVFYRYTSCVSGHQYVKVTNAQVLRKRAMIIVSTRSFSLITFSLSCNTLCFQKCRICDFLPFYLLSSFLVFIPFFLNLSIYWCLTI